MSSFYWPAVGGGGGVPVYTTFSAFPPGTNVGDLAVAADTGDLYEWSGSAWQVIAGPGVALSLGAVGSSPNADAASITANVLTLQPADGTHPGVVTTGAQTLAGAKTLSGTINLSGLTASLPLQLDGSKNIISALISLTAGVTGVLPIANGGTNVSSLGTLSDVGTDGIVITGGSGCLITSASIAQHVADTTHNGYLASTDWNTFNGKQPLLTIGNLTDSGTDGITVTGGTGAIIGSGTSIAQHVADTTHNGYLASADWNTFNGKQAAGSYLTALTGDGTASGPGSATFTLASVATAGTTGSSTSIPAVTINAKGLVTGVTGNAVVAPAGTLSGTVLNSTVVTSSLTAVGTITSGTWTGTTIAVANGGTGVTSVTTAPAATGFAGWDANKNLSANNHIEGYTTTATAAGTTALVVGSTYQQFFTGSTTQTVTLPVAGGLALGMAYQITNNSTGIVTVQSSGGNTILAQGAGVTAVYTCILTSGTTAASWSAAALGSAPSIQNSVFVSTPTGFGSTNTKIRTFTSGTLVQVGTGITYTSSATNGDSFTINTAGLYHMDVIDASTGNAQIGISVNSAQLTTNIASITAANRLTYTNNGANLSIAASTVRRFAVNDVVRAHGDGTALTSGNADLIFYIVQIAN